MTTLRLDNIACPYCQSLRHQPWAKERGFHAVRCAGCALIYCNPRPPLDAIDSAVRTGAHGDEAQGLVVVARRVGSKVARYRRVLAALYEDVWRLNQPITWLDVGAGYGEVVEAVMALAPAGSRISGLEPMQPKAEHARHRGLEVTQDYLRPGMPQVQFVSLVDVFSHVPDFGAFLHDLRQALKPGGELFLETGNLADVRSRAEFPGELGLPDHLVFAGESHLRGYLDRAGFDIIAVRRLRIDTVLNLAKNLVKKLMGRPSALGIPYTSRYRQLQIRARLRP